MTTAIQPFSFEGREVRVQADDAGDPWFCAADVCANLDLDNVSMAVAPLDDDEKAKKVQPSIGLRAGVAPLASQWYVNEPGLYRLLTRCDKPKARPFQRWVTHEVLPAIRRTGSYSSAPSTALDLRDPSALQRLALELTGLVQEQQKALAEAAPKVAAYDAFLDTTSTCCITTAGKAIGRHPILFHRWLETHRHIYRRGRDVLAKQEHIEAGRMVERVVPAGEGRSTTQTRLTARGLAYFHERCPADLGEVSRAPRRRLPPPMLAALPGGHP